MAQNPIVPPEPALWREVTGVINYGDGVSAPQSNVARFTRPHVPAVRTTADGRLGVYVQGGQSPKFTLLRPEQLAQPLQLAPPLAAVDDDDYSFVLSTRSDFRYSHPGVTGVAESGIQGFTTLTYSSALGEWRVAHAALWETAPPYANSAGQDVYSLNVLVTVNRSVSGRQTQLFTTPVEVVVDNPKSSTAAISSVTVVGTPTGPGPIPYTASGFEPVICGDGRLLVLRVAATNMNWKHPDTNVVNTGVGMRDMAYAYYETGAVADAANWGDIIPITVAPYDSRINKKFGFAMNLFRDAEGNPIAEGSDFGASYPWIDRDAKNLFFESIHDRLRQAGRPIRYTSGQSEVIDPAGGTRPDPYFDSSQYDNHGNHMGVSFAGLWSRGKVVLLDNLLNNMDLQIGDRREPSGSGSGYPQMRRVELFEDDNNTGTAYDGSLRLGYGRANRLMPPGENSNSNISDSIENKLNLNKHARPIALRDIVWMGSVGQMTDDIVFDDYLDPDALIVAHMNGLLTWEQNLTLPPVHGSILLHHSGWNEQSGGWTDTVRLQNAATDDGTSWTVPLHGEASAGVRLEPAAVGGIVGKGLWLDGDERVTFAVPAQNRSGLASRDYYVGLFLDARFADDGLERRILTFPDGTALSVFGRRQLIYSDNGTTVHRVTLPSGSSEIMPEGGWCHVALQIRDARHTVDLHLNGMLYDRWQGDGQQLFSPIGTLHSGGSNGGDLIVGAPPGDSNAFAGWVDELRVIAHTLDLETACNQAGGTLCGVPDGHSGPWATEADRYPQWAHEEYAAWLRHHGETAESKFVSFHDYSGDLKVHRESVATSGLTWRRESVLFPEGPLFQNAPRPESRHNAFCASCHFTGAQAGLSLDALKVSLVDARLDPRRQPSQPPALLHGFLPPGIVTETAFAAPQPATPISLGMGSSALVDDFMLAKYTGTASVQSFTLLSAKTGRALAEIPLGALTEVDPVVLGTNEFSLRANLDSEQGAVSWVWDGNVQPDTPTAPHVLFGSGLTLNGGTYVVRATGDDGAQVVAAIKILDITAGATPRIVAGYQADFRPVSPKPAWSYAWNALGPINQPATSLQRLAWSPATNAYTSLGFTPSSGDPGRFVQCKSNGGHPGGGISQGTSHGQTVHHYAVATYRIPFDGNYEVVNGGIDLISSSGNGVRLWMGIESQSGVATGAFLTSAGAAVPFDSSIVQSGPIALKQGDRIHVGVGPRGNDAFDSYVLNYSIRFVP